MTPYLYLSKHIPVNKSLKLRVEDNIGIISNCHNYQIDFLNETALFVFQLIDGKKTVDEIVECFISNFDVDRNVFESDVIEILRGFQWKKLIMFKENL